MKYPKIGAGNRYRVAVAELSGGLNTRELPEKVPAGQLTECSNLWWKNGVLASRPGLKYLSSQSRQDGEDTFSYRLYARNTVPVDTGYGRPFADKCQRGYRFGYTGLNGEEWRSSSTLVTAADSVLHIPFPAERLEGFEGNTDGSLWMTESGQVYANLKDGTLQMLTSRLYKPLLLVGGFGAEGLYAPRPEPNGTVLETPNLLAGGFRARYTTDGIGKIFYLPKQGLDPDRPVTAVYTRASGQQVTHIIPGGADKGLTGEDGLVMHCIRWKGCVYFTQSDQAEPVALEAAGISDNLEITAYKTDPKAASIIGGMRFSCWYGGDYSGLGGGTRLFVAGNPQYPNRVYWSDVGNPLYFPENNYLIVGDAGEPITAFAKQGRHLIIFKEREIYALTYGAATLAADGAAVTATGPVFGLSQLHSGVGCDCPGTIALCSNRLVWLHSDGRVYMLSGVNAFSQSNVRPLSSPIETELAKLSELNRKKATAGCFEGRYLLLADNKIFLFRYEDSGFEQYAAAADAEKAQRRLGWYIWNLSQVRVNFEQLLADGVQAVLIGFRQTDGRLMRYRLEGDRDEWVPNTTITPLPIVSRFRTALLRLPSSTGEGGFRRVRQVYMGVGQPKGGRLQVWYHDGDRTCQDSFTLETPPPDQAGTANALRQVRRLRLTPHMVRIDRFSMTVACEGPVLVDGISVYYS